MKIDKTFILSLSERKTDRLLPLIEHLKEMEWDNYEVVEATKLSDGKLGLIISVAHLLRQLIYNEEISCVLICEDDFRFLQPAQEIIDKCLEQVGEDFDLIYLGCNLWQTEVKLFSENLIQLNDAYALHSVIYSKSGMKKVLKAIEEMLVTIPLDVLIKDKVLPDGKSFCAFPILTTQISGQSDIEKKFVDWSKVLQDRFNEKTKHLI